MRNFLTVSALVVLTACGGGDEETGSSTNDTPISNAGVLQNILAGTSVTLDGSGSTDANGDALTYSWALTSKPAGSAASLTNSTSPKPTFQADVTGTYVASLVVNDGKVSSQASTVTVTATVANAAPVANAGTAQNTVAGSTVTLDGSSSSDANGDTLTYAWTLTSKPAGSSAALSSATSAKPTFTADMAGTYVASLTVNDGKASSNVTTVSVTASVAGTSVSGLIDSSTVWTKINSPYVMTGNVLIPGGVTLSIEAGVEVRGDNFKIQTEGTLNAKGTPSAPVFITNVAITPAGKQTSNHLISIVGATITGGSVYPPTGNAVYGSLVLTDSKISNGSYLYLWYPIGDNRVERNVFTNTGGISYGIDARGAPVSLSIKNNKFIGWSGGYAVENWAMYGTNVASVTLNSFLSTDRVALSLPSGYSSVALDAASNYWGTTSPSAISSMIFDRNDDLNSGGVINFTPALSAPDSATPM